MTATHNIARNIQQVGGKAYHLYRLVDLGFEVPAFIVIPKSIMDGALGSDSYSIDGFRNYRELADDADIDELVYSRVDSEIKSPESKLFAVRSSALNEDGAKLSFAGLFESFLYVEYQDLPRFVKKVWSSAFSERVGSYLEGHNSSGMDGMAVVIQEMIDPDVSGVAFGVDPSTGQQGSKVINSLFGLGEGVVSGRLAADTYYISPDGNVKQTLVVKDQKIVRAGSGETKLANIAKDKESSSSLATEEIRRIAAVLDRLGEVLDSPQDIEFAIVDGEILLLQTRPITAIFVSETDEAKSNRIIWDNSNIVESYPGVTTPLTFSYILRAYAQVYSQLARIFGVTKKKIAANEDVFGNMLGLINGRVYYNLFSWYRMLALFPGYRLNARFMENMMGVKERFQLPQEKDSSKLKAALQTMWMVIRILGHMATIKRQTKNYLRDVEKTIREYKSMDIESMDAFQLMSTWKGMDSYLVAKWRAPILTDSFALYYFGKLQKMLEQNKVSDNPNIHNDLLCGSKDIISVEPIHRTMELASIVSNDEHLKSLFLNESSERIIQVLKAEHPSFKAKIDEYLDEFGDRCIGELKLETVSLKEDPAQYIDSVRSFVKQGITSKSATNLDLDLRLKAEREVRSAFRYKPLKLIKFNRLLRQTRFLVSNRENLRYERTRVFGITREVMAEIGKRFERGGKLDNYRDVFYLTIQEVFGFIQGTSVDTDLRALVTTRKKEYEKYESMPPPAERITTYGTVNIGNDFFTSTFVQDETGVLKGVGCCPGKVTGKVRVINHPSEVEGLDGDILVTSSTDPGWVTLFPTASAILVERGSILSHSAIVSREMGIPCIVGVTGLLKRLKTGDRVEMDGSTGIINEIPDEEHTS